MIELFCFLNFELLKSDNKAKGLFEKSNTSSTSRAPCCSLVFRRSVSHCYSAYFASANQTKRSLASFLLFIWRFHLQLVRASSLLWSRSIKEDHLLKTNLFSVPVTLQQKNGKFFVSFWRQIVIILYFFLGTKSVKWWRFRRRRQRQGLKTTEAWTPTTTATAVDSRTKAQGRKGTRFGVQVAAGDAAHSVPSQAPQTGAHSGLALARGGVPQELQCYHQCHRR